MKITINLEPKPQSRPRFTKQGHAYELPDIKAYKRKIKGHVAKHFNEPYLRPILLTAAFYIRPPQYLNKVKKNAQALKDEVLWVNKKPDVDNYLKAVMDAINGVAYKDDGQVCAQYAEKRYSHNPRIELVIEEI
jgi:Holliday junction resolvase RusA-like endonuclease